MDHGPIIAQEKIALDGWNPYINELRTKLAEIAGRMLIKIIPDWMDGEVKAVPQDHSLATFTKKIAKDDGFIDQTIMLDIDMITTDQAQNIWRKIRALNPDPSTYTIIATKGGLRRIKITRANLENGKLVIEKVIPEGKKEMAFEDWKRGNLNTASY